MQNRLNWRLILIILVIGILAFAAWSVFRGNRAVNPRTTVNTEGDAGSVVARWLYEYSDFYEAIDQNDDVLSYAQDDIVLFARSTRPEFRDSSVLVGFTFNEGFEKDGETYIFTGYYYGLDDEVEVRLTPHGRGVYALSITNLTDSTNIDGQLSLNGQRNSFIQSLPIEEGRYSVRYQLPNDRVVVTFYEGYTSRDVDAVEKLVTEALGSTLSSDVVYSINAKGVFTLDEIRRNLTNPLP